MKMKELGQIEMTKWRARPSASLGTQELLGPGFFQSVDHTVGFMKIANILGEREAGLHHHRHAHHEIGAHPQIERKLENAAADQEQGCPEGDVRKAYPGTGWPAHMRQMLGHGDSFIENGLKIR
jgi:hypothetical protein